MTGNLIARYANEPLWAVVGASNERYKYGNRIYRTLRGAGYKVYAVNNREAQVEGDAAYKTLSDLPEVPTVVDMVVPPENAMGIVQEAQRLGVKAVWFQPGSEDHQAILWAKQNGLDVVQDCILVQHVQNPGSGR
jgi:predicted CoA-binding protein